MNVVANAIPPQLAERFARASMRERVLVAVAIAIVVPALAYSVVWQPLTRDIARLRESVPRADAAAALAIEHARTIVPIASAPPALSSAELRSVVERALADRGMRTELIEARDDRLHVVMAGVDFAGLVAVLDGLATQHGIRAIEATLTARVEPGLVRAELTLAR